MDPRNHEFWVNRFKSQNQKLKTLEQDHARLAMKVAHYRRKRKRGLSLVEPLEILARETKLAKVERQIKKLQRTKLPYYREMIEKTRKADYWKILLRN